MKAYTDKSKIIDTIGDHVGGKSRPTLFASSSRRRQHLPTPPRQEMRGSIGSSCFGCARNDLRSIDRSRRTVQTPHYEPNGSARAGEGRSVVRGRVLSQSLLVARERRRREPGYNPVIDTTALTSGEGHVVKDGTSRRVRKILAGVPASVVIRDHILALSFSRSKRQYWTVGNRPIRNYDLRSLHRNSAEAQIQDRSRQKTGLNTVPGFSRVYPSFPRTTPSFPRAIRHSRGRGNPEKTKHTAKPPLRAAKGTRAQHAGDARKPPTFPPSEAPNTKTTPPSSPHPLRHSRMPRHSRDHPSFPRAIRHSRGRGNPAKTKHTAKPPLRGAKGTRAQHAGDARKPPTPPLRSSEHQDNIPPSSPPVIPASHPSFPRAIRHSRKPYVIPASLPSFPRTREPREKQSTPPNLPFAERRGRVRSTQGMPENHQHRPFEAPNTKTTPPPSSPHPLRHSREPSVIPADYPVIPADAGTQRKTKHTAKPPLRAAKGTRAQHAGDARKPPTPPLRSSEHQDKASHHSHHSNHINHSSDDCASSQPFARISLTGRAEWHIFGII